MLLRATALLARYGAMAHWRRLSIRSSVSHSYLRAGDGRRWAITLGSTVGIAIAYYAAVRFGLAYLSKDVAVFWPASGIATGILIASSRRVTPMLVVGVIVGTVAAGNLVRDESFLSSVLTGICNAGEATLAAWLLEQWFGRPFAFTELRRLKGFLVAAALAAAASAIASATALMVMQTSAPFWEVWRAGFLSHVIGIVVVAPLLIGLGQIWREPPRPLEWIEGVGLLALVATTSLFVAAQPSGSWISFSPFAAVVPLLLWATTRCPPTFAIAGAFIASNTVILAIIFRLGHFGDSAAPIIERVKGAQAAVMALIVCTLALVALFAQRKQAEKDFRESERRLAKERGMLARLHEVQSRLWLTRDLRQALDEILGGAVELLGADMGIIRILDTERAVLKTEAQRGFKQESLECFHEESVGYDSAFMRALRSGERIVIADVETDPFFTSFRRYARTAGYRALQATPIMNREDVPLGILATHFRLVHRPPEQELRLLDLYVRLAADIIEHHRVDATLRESEERLRLAQLKTGVGIWELNLGTGKVAWSPELAAIFGLEPEAMKSYADFRARVHPDDVSGVERARDAAVRNQERFSVEFRIVRSDGNVRWISSTGSAVYEEATSKSTRILGNAIDITERKWAELALQVSEEKLAGILEIAGDAIISIDANGRITIFNKAAERVFGYSRGEVVGQPIDLLIPARFRAAHRQHMERFASGPDVARRMGERQEVIALRKNHDEFPTEASISKLEIGGERLYTVVLRDITERKRSDERQRGLTGELDHRVKNALATVSCVVSQTKQGSKSLADFVETLNGRIRSMAETHELLSSSRWRGVSLAELVRRELAPYATPNNTEIGGPNVVVRPEVGQVMAMVLHELATNAAKYGALSTNNGHVSIRWDRRSNGHVGSRLVFEWQEAGGPHVVAPSLPGYGTSTIRDLIPYEFGGTVDLVLAPAGVRCRLELPADCLGNAGIEIIDDTGQGKSRPCNAETCP